MIAIPASTPTTGRGRWPLLLLASAALHAAVLAGWRHTPEPVAALGGERPTPMSITLVSLAGRQLSTPQPPRSKPAAPPTQHPPALPHRHAKATVVARPAPTPHPLAPATAPRPPAAPAAMTLRTATPPHPVAAAETAGGTAHAAALEQLVASRIRGALARYFNYPRRARREGWQGAVVLDFRIDIDGTISAINVARSSGYTLLDRAAVGALTKVGRIPLDGALPHPLELQLPVIYHLEES